MRHSRRLRAGLALAGLASLAMGLVLLPGAPRSLAAAKSHGGGSAVTVHGPRMWDPRTGRPYPDRSTVTVSQTKNLVNQSVRVSWTGFTPTNWEDEPPYAYNLTAYPVMLAECKGTHPRISQCYGASDEGETAAYGKYGAFNTTYEGSTKKGTGWGVVDIETISQNTGLDCETGHPCSLLILPAQGGNLSQDNGTSGPYTCANHSNDQISNGTATAYRDFGGDNLACSWADRIVVPLRFAPTASSCPNNAAALSVEGSPMMNAAMTQWDSGLCSGPAPISVTFSNAVPEPEAITEVLGGQGDVALTTLPSSTGTTSGNRRYAYAPIGVTATVLGYWADNPNTGEPQSGMRLDPRLMAKLITLSYNLEDVSCKANGHAKGCDPGIGASNDADFFEDPEFTRLNPHLVSNGNTNQFPAVPIVLQGESDMTYELTRWIADNPAARGFVRGTPDRGMRVNKYYKNMAMPANTFVSDDPSQYMTNAFSPVAGLSGTAGVAGDLVLSAAPGYEYFATCPPPAKVCNTRFTPELQGERALYAVMDSGDTANFEVPAAALLNHAGRYVEATRASMAAALTSMVTAKNGVTQQVNLSSRNPRAYPLTMVVYAMVPTSGVGTAKGDLIARWLRYVAGSGQTPGQTPGRLANGYLPLPRSMRDQALKVANEVQAQSGNPGSSPSPTPTSTTPSTSPSASGSLSASASPSSSIALPKVTPRLTTVAVRDPLSSGLTRYALPALLIVGGLAALGGASSFVASGPLGPELLTRLKRVYRGTKHGRSS